MIYVGLAVTAAVTAATAVGWLDRAEWLSQDERFLHARIPPQELSDDVRLVAIDDQALETVHRWPWPRTLLADALAEIGRAGAKTMAMDVLLPEPEDGSQAGTVSVGDEALGSVLAGIPTVLAVNMDMGRVFGEDWSGDEAQQALAALCLTLARDITAEPGAIAVRAGLTGAQRDRFLQRPVAFKRYALWRHLVDLRRQGKTPATLEDFRAECTGGDRQLGAFAEEKLLERAFDVDRAFGALPRSLVGTGGQGSPLDTPPIAALAAKAGALGFANSRHDADDWHRRVPPVWSSAYGEVPQLGLAAALLHQGKLASDMQLSAREVRMPDGWTMPLSDGKVFVDWPGHMFEGVGAQPDTMVRSTGVVAIGRLVDISRNRRKLEQLEQRYRALLDDIRTMQTNLPEDAAGAVPVGPEARKAIRDQVEFLFGADMETAAQLPAELNEDERRMAGTYREWLRLDRQIPESRDLIRKVEAEIRQELSGKLVFVGYMATGVEADMINTLYGPRTPGVYFHAAIASMALGHHAVRLPPDWLAPVLTAAMCLVVAVGVWKLGTVPSTLLALGALGAYVGVVGVWLFNAADLMLPLGGPVVGGVLVQVAGLGTAAVAHQRERARITRQFRARVSGQLVDRLVENPDALSVRGEQRMSTILFGDLAGFTTISEKLGSEAVVATLNLYMGALAKELTAKSAYVNKFLGDGVLAFWSAFGEEPRQAQLALEACVECQRQVKAIGQRPDRQGLPLVSLRLGLATGVVTIGDCGAPPDLNDYTVIGDAANLSARLESANKQFGTSILMDGNTRHQVTDDTGLHLVRLGRVVVVGQSVPVELFTLLVEPPPEGWLAAVGAAVDAFEKGDFAAARAAWDAVEARWGATKMAVPFRHAMDDPADPRDGVLRLHAK